jgi:hypothetical protein
MFAHEVAPERRTEILGRIAAKVVDLRLTPVAVVLLESTKPLSFVGSQMMVFFQPIITAVFPFQQYDEVAALLEDRANIEELIQTIERLEDERRHAKG